MRPEEYRTSTTKVDDPAHANCKSLSFSWILVSPFGSGPSGQPEPRDKLPEVSLSAGLGEFDKGRGDDLQAVPFSCRLVDATSGNTQQLEATGGNSQRSEAKVFRQQTATGSNSRQHQQLDRNPAVNRRVAGSDPA